MKVSFQNFIDGKGQPDVISSDALAASKALQRRTAGRKPTYNWDAYIAELMQRYPPGQLPDSDHTISDEMMPWCVENFGQEPADSATRDKIRIVRLVYAGLRSGSQ